MASELPNGPAESPQPPEDDGLSDVRRRRAELRESLDALERALAAPAPGRIEEWTAGVRAALAALSREFRSHIKITEGRDGLYEGVLTTAPRLAKAVTRLQTEHGEISAYLDDLRACVDTVVGEEGVTDVRELGVALFTRMVRHRQRGADLVYEAYASDIGGEN
jgi:hypothetical protein